MADVLVCDRCGARTPASDPASTLTWMTSVDGSGATARTRHCCPRCTRENVRGIEAKLDAAWW